MDQYLTSGGRSIPKLVAFGEDGEERSFRSECFLNGSDV
jgi:hypothetical protein